MAANPVAVLESVRRFADRITVFTQAGQIRVPPAFRAAYAYLERSVVPVEAPRQGGIFHPKVWVIRFTAPDGDVRLRFLCLSRNLTFDRSWDTVLRLDGKPGDGPNELSQPISDFLRALPGMAISPVAGDRLRTHPRSGNGGRDGRLGRSTRRSPPGANVADRTRRPPGVAVSEEQLAPTRHGAVRGTGVPRGVRQARPKRRRRQSAGDARTPSERPALVVPGGPSSCATMPSVKLILRTPKAATSPRNTRSSFVASTPSSTSSTSRIGRTSTRDPRMRPTPHSTRTSSSSLSSRVETRSTAQPVLWTLRRVRRSGSAGCSRSSRCRPTPVPLPEDEEAARALDRIAMRIGALRFTAEIGELDADLYPLKLTGHGDLRLVAPPRRRVVDHWGATAVARRWLGRHPTRSRARRSRPSGSSPSRR